MLLYSTVVSTRSVPTSCAALPVPPPKASPKSRRASRRLPSTPKTIAQRVRVRNQTLRTRPPLPPLSSPNHRYTTTGTHWHPTKPRDPGTIQTPMGLFTLRRVKVRAHFLLNDDPWVSLWNGQVGSAFMTHLTWSQGCLPAWHLTAQAGWGCPQTASHVWWAPRRVQKLKERFWLRRGRGANPKWHKGRDGREVTTPSPSPSLLRQSHSSLFPFPTHVWRPSFSTHPRLSSDLSPSLDPKPGKLWLPSTFDLSLIHHRGMCAQAVFPEDAPPTLLHQHRASQQTVGPTSIGIRQQPLTMALFVSHSQTVM